MDNLPASHRIESASRSGASAACADRFTKRLPGPPTTQHRDKRFERGGCVVLEAAGELRGVAEPLYRVPRGLEDLTL